MTLEGYLYSKDLLIEQGYVELETTADLLSFFNHYGSPDKVQGEVTRWVVGDLDEAFSVMTKFLAVKLKVEHPHLGALIFYNEDIAKRAKKRIELGDHNRQTAQPVR